MNLAGDGKMLINGAMGITGIKKTSTFTIGIVLVIITLLVVLNLINSRAAAPSWLSAITRSPRVRRHQHHEVQADGVCDSAVFAGMAGVLYAMNYSSLVGCKFDYNTSILILVFVVLGGIGNICAARSSPPPC